MAQIVFDQLETVQVEEQHGQLVMVRLSLGDRRHHAIFEAGSVGQICEGVVKGLVPEFLFKGLPLADVSDIENDAR